MRHRADRRPAVPAPVVLVLRVLGAVLLAAMAWIHLYLWGQGYSGIAVIGPAFLVNAIAGFALAAGLLGTPRRLLGWVAAAGALLELGTLAALLLSVTVGLFGFVETTSAPLFWEMVVVALAGMAVLGVLAGVPVRDDAPPPGELLRMRG
jgi:hypothetical protein